MKVHIYFWGGNVPQNLEKRLFWLGAAQCLGNEWAGRKRDAILFDIFLRALLPIPKTVVETSNYWEQKIPPIFLLDDSTGRSSLHWR